MMRAVGMDTLKVKIVGKRSHRKRIKRIKNLVGFSKER